MFLGSQARFSLGQGNHYPTRRVFESLIHFINIHWYLLHTRLHARNQEDSNEQIQACSLSSGSKDEDGTAQGPKKYLAS